MDSVEQVEENVRVAETFSPLSAQEKGILARGLELVPRGPEGVVVAAGAAPGLVTLHVREPAHAR